MIRVRLAVIGDEVSQDLREVIELCLEHGFRGVEVRSFWGAAPHELSLRRCVDIGERIRAAGLEVAAFASSTFKRRLPDGDADRQNCAESLRRALAQCEAMEAPLLRVFSFFRDGEPRPLHAAAAFDRVLDSVGEFRVELAVETGTRTHTPSAAEVRTLLRHVDRPEVGALWDPGNSVFSGFDSGPLPAGIDLVPGGLRHLHVKDPRGGRAYVELGTGDIDWPALLRSVHAAGYRGWVSLETHWREHRVLTALERDEPWGYGFSAGGRAASVRCMRVLADWARAIETEDIVR